MEANLSPPNTEITARSFVFMRASYESANLSGIYADVSLMRHALTDGQAGWENKQIIHDSPLFHAILFAPFFLVLVLMIRQNTPWDC